ncbi:ABC transporter permease [Faecalicatena contorta]|uniref:ABC transporter permease n=1 Tax=Faecalicatena contorta TaxID=39482 RepID=UPI001FA8EFA0|nr:ABC transporter permease [Faecalicatena contorta]
MKRKLQNTTSKPERKRIQGSRGQEQFFRKGYAGEKVWPVLTIIIILGIWQTASSTGMVPRFMLPSPIDVAKAFITDFPLLMSNAKVTLLEAFIGLGMGVAVGFLMAVLMDRFEKMYQAFYPLIVLTQTVPTVAIAPLLVLWFGYEMLPKVILIVIVTFFPVTVSLLDGFKSADRDTVNLLRSMGASKVQIFWFVKFPGSLGQFFASLRISVSYAVVGAVIAEWLGGFSGLGVYMTRVKKAFSFDKMFAVIFLISVISLLLMGAVNLLQKKCMPWEERE